MRAKKNRASFAAVALLAALGFSAPAGAQPDPREQASRRFDSTAPAIGEPMPDLMVYGADGKKLRLGQLLQGHYTVIVLGCLT